jgi:hypothetical protein
MPTTSRIYDFTGFDTVSVSTGIRAEITTGGDYSIHIEGPDDILDKIEVSVASGRLSIGIGRNFLDFVFGGALLSLLGRGDVGVTATISLPVLNGAEASAGARIRAGTVKSDRFHAEASSGARIDVDAFAGGDVRAAASSGGVVEMRGTAGEIDGGASSGGAIRAERLTATRGRLDASSGGSVRAEVTQSVRANASSGGSIEIEGAPQDRQSNSSSGGTVLIH